MGNRTETRGMLNFFGFSLVGYDKPPQKGPKWSISSKIRPSVSKSAYFCRNKRVCVLLRWATEKRKKGATAAASKNATPAAPVPIYMYMYVYMYIYIYAVRLLSGPSLALLEVIIWSKFVFSKTPIAKKHYKNRGFSPFVFWKKIARKNFGSYYLVQVGVF